MVGKVSCPLADLSSSRSSPDRAEVGHYSSSLANGVSVDLAASDHGGMFSYRFPGGLDANIVVEASRFLPSHRGLGTEQHYVNGNISLVYGDNGYVAYEGDATYHNGWNLCENRGLNAKNALLRRV